MAAVFWLSFRRRAMVWRSRVILHPLSRALRHRRPPARAGLPEPVAAHGRWRSGATAPGTSSFMHPAVSGPVPVTSQRGSVASAMLSCAERGDSSTVLAAQAPRRAAGRSGRAAAARCAPGRGSAASAYVASRASTPTVSPLRHTMLSTGPQRATALRRSPCRFPIRTAFRRLRRHRRVA